jgi:hypothetical protein
MARRAILAVTVAILNPPGSRDFASMPEDFGTRMSDAELDTLVSFPLGSRSEP